MTMRIQLLLLITLSILGSCDSPERMIQLKYQIPVGEAKSGKGDDLFADPNPPLTKDYFEHCGIQFPSGSELITNLGFSGFIMENTESNHERLQKLLDSRFRDRWSIVNDSIEVKTQEGDTGESTNSK